MSFWKPDSLKEALTKALDPAHHIADNPDRLQIEVIEGSVHALATPGLGFRYQYEIAVGVLDYTGTLDEIMIPLLIWLQRWEKSQLLDHSKAARGVKFERQPLDAEAANIMFTIQLTEAVSFEQREDGGFDAVHRKDPPMADTGRASLLHRIYVNDELVAECGVHPVTG
ncbi:MULTISPECIES: phage tail protein [Brevundimonas]|uniref:phage tail protein n=1 Tax=Brevundimonas sp. UBA7507 TaxID=1946137 RepID=UPI002579FBB2|nr:MULTISPECIES: phage tail protein [Brevundimonas]